VPGKSAESGAALIKGFVCPEVSVTKQQTAKALVKQQNCECLPIDMFIAGTSIINGRETEDNIITYSGK